MTAPEGPKLPTAAERRAAVSLGRRLNAARSLLRENGYLVLIRPDVVRYIGAPFYRGYFHAPAPTVDNDGKDIHSWRS